jgi:polysaccharide pyruvyl transferase CsaB
MTMGSRSHAFRVGISGSYGGLNLGDEAILEAIITQLRRALPVEIVVFSRDPQDTLQRHRIEHAVPVRQLTRAEARAEIEQLDVFVLGGGGILYDNEAEEYLREAFLAYEAGVPVVVYAISAGPLHHRSTRGAVRDALNNAAIVTVRDRQARKLLEDVGVEQDIQVTADPALLLGCEPLAPDLLKREGLDTERRLVGFSVREPGPAAPDIDVDHYHQLLANAADFMVDRLDADIVFVPLERRHMDMQHSHAVVAQMQCVQRATVLKGEYTPRQLLTLVGHFEFSVGMRLHFLIFCALQNVPFVALPYASKVTDLLKDLEMEMPPLYHVNTGRLLAAIDRSWDWRDSIRERIRRRLPSLQQRALETNRLLVDLLVRDVASAQST